MHRLGSSALLLVVGLALVSCGGGGSSSRPFCSTAAEGSACGTNQVCHSGSCVTAASLTVYWSFLRHVVQPTPGTVGYDTARSPGDPTGPCFQTEVDTVTITDAAGNPIDPANPSYPCVISGTQGVTIPSLTPGTYDLTFTGYIGTAALYQAQVPVVTNSGSANTYDAVIPGIQEDLDVFAQFYNVTGSAPAISNTCALASAGGAIATISYNLVDRNNTSVASGTTDCTDPAGVPFRQANGAGIDRDLYTIRIRGFDNAPTPNLLEDSATTLRGVNPTTGTCVADGFFHMGPGSAAEHTWTTRVFDVSSDPNLGLFCP